MTEHWPDSLMAASAIGVSYMSAIISFRGAVNPAWALGRAFVVNNFEDLWVNTSCLHLYFHLSLPLSIFSLINFNWKLQFCAKASFSLLLILLFMFQVFWVGPVLGGACAALCHEYIFNEQRDVTVSMTNLSTTPPESEEDFQR